MRKHENRVLRLILPVLLLIMVACADSAPTPEPVIEEPTTDGLDVAEVAIKDTLKIVLWQAPTTLNPHLTRSRKDLVTARIVYEPLATFNSQGKLTPILAAEIPSFENGGIASDGKSVTWKLLPDVTWSDGEPFTADDVVFTFNYIINPDIGTKTQSAYSGAIDSVEALDDTTVKVSFHQETPTWNLYFTGLQGVILPRHVVEGYEGSWLVDDFIDQGEAGEEALFKLMVGTGPYRPIEARQEEVLFLANELVETNRITYLPNDFYRQAEKLYFSRLELKGGGTTNGAGRAVLRFEEADFAWNLQVEVEDLTAWEQEDKGVILTAFGSRVERLLLNRTDPSVSLPEAERSTEVHAHPILSDLRVRQAIAHAIDRDAIAALYGKTGCPIANILARFEQTCNSDYEAIYPYDLEKAATLLDEAGWIDTDGDDIRDNGQAGGNQPLQLVFQTSSNALRQQTQEIIRDSLRQVGVDIEIEVIDATLFSQAGPAENFYADLQELATSTPNPDSENNMGRWLCSAIPKPDNDWTGRNYERFCDPEYDDLYDESTRQIDPIEREKIFAVMNWMIIRDVVTIPLVHRAGVSAVRNNITGVDLTPWDSEFWNIQDWKRIQDDDS